MLHYKKMQYTARTHTRHGTEYITEENESPVVT